MKLLSKREKAMLYILAVVLVLAGMVMLIILPIRKRADELDAELLSAQVQLDDMQALIRQADSMEADIALLETEIETEQEGYLPAMNSDDLDKYITGLLQKHGLVAQSLAISSDGSQSETDMIRTYQVDVLARGRISQFMQLLDTVKETEGLRIAKIDLKKAAAATASPTPAPTPKPKKKRRATPTPAPTPEPTPTPYDPSYSMNLTFVAAEYDENGTLPVQATATPAEQETAAPADGNTDTLASYLDQ